MESKYDYNYSYAWGNSLIDGLAHARISDYKSKLDKALIEIKTKKTATLLQHNGYIIISCSPYCSKLQHNFFFSELG